MTYLKHNTCSKPSLQVVANLSAVIIDIDVTAIKFCIKKHQLTNILVDRRFHINVMENHIHKFFRLFQSKIALFILYMINNAQVNFIEILQNIIISIQKICILIT